MNGGFPEAEDPDPDDADRTDPEFDRIRGWLSPDDRLWRHPSEMGGAGTTRPTSTTTVDRSRSGQWVASTAAVCVVGALLVGGLLMANTGASPTASPHTTATTTAALVSPTTEPGNGNALTGPQMAQTVSTIGPSMVALTVTVAGRTVHTTGVTVESGGLVVVLASAVAGASSITTVDPHGRRTSAAVLASDQNSNLAIVRVQRDLPVAQFSDDTDMKAGDATVAVAPEPRPNHAGVVTDAVYAGTVRSSGTAVDADLTTSAMSATAVNAPLSPGDTGCALINRAGAVTGIMDTTTTMKGRKVSVFLPADLVVGVATQLIATGSVQHGWLGVDASDRSTPTSPPGATTTASTPNRASTAAIGGALVDTVQPDGAAARAGIRVGDSIVDIDGRTVRSLADLRTRLYAEPPGTTVTVTYDRNGATATVGVALTGAQAAASPAG
jgi:S1-C subfamily serine protease